MIQTMDRIRTDSSRTQPRQLRAHGVFQDSLTGGVKSSHPKGLSLIGFSSGATLPDPDGIPARGVFLSSSPSG